MRSTGEVLGLDRTFGPAFAKSQEAAYGALPTSGTATLWVPDADKRAIVPPARLRPTSAFKLLRPRAPRPCWRATASRRRWCASSTRARATSRGSPGSVDVGDRVVNTPQGSRPAADGWEIRSAVVATDIPYILTLSGLTAMVRASRPASPGASRPRSSMADQTELAGRPGAPGGASRAAT